MKVKKVNTEKAPKAIGPYVQANKVGELIFCSGQLGINPETGKLVDGGVLEEAKQVFKNIQAILEEAGSSMNHVVKTLVLLKDIADFAEKNGYSQLMPYFCETDKAVIEHFGGTLYREHTVADGYEDCDYWIKNRGE